MATPVQKFSRYLVNLETVMNGLCEEVVEAQVLELLRTNPAMLANLVTKIKASKIDMNIGGLDLSPISLEEANPDLSSEPVEITFQLPKGTLMTALALLGMQLETIRVDEEGQSKGSEIQVDWTAEKHVLEIMVYTIADVAKTYGLLEGMGEDDAAN